jgi:hypothetical protein
MTGFYNLLATVDVLLAFRYPDSAFGTITEVEAIVERGDDGRCDVVHMKETVR